MAQVETVTIERPASAAYVDRSIREPRKSTANPEAAIVRALVSEGYLPFFVRLSASQAIAASRFLRDLEAEGGSSAGTVGAYKAQEGTSGTRDWLAPPASAGHMRAEQCRARLRKHERELLQMLQQAHRIKIDGQTLDNAPRFGQHVTGYADAAMATGGISGMLRALFSTVDEIYSTF